MADYYRVEAKDYQITDEVKRHKLALMTGSTLLLLCFFYSDSQISSFLIFKLKENGEQVIGLYPFLLAFAAYHALMYQTLLNQLITNVKNLEFSKLTCDSIDLPADLREALADIDKLKTTTIHKAVNTQTHEKSLQLIHRHLTELKSLGTVDEMLIHYGLSLLNNDPIPEHIDTREVTKNLAKYMKTLLSYRNLILAGDTFEQEVLGYRARINCLDKDLETWKRKELAKINDKYDSLVKKVSVLDKNFQKTSAWAQPHFNSIYKAIPYTFFGGAVALSTYAFLIHYCPEVILRLM